MLYKRLLKKIVTSISKYEITEYVTLSLHHCHFFSVATFFVLFTFLLRRLHELQIPSVCYSVEINQYESEYNFKSKDAITLVQGPLIGYNVSQTCR